MNDTVAVILAAGKGTRMKADLPKVLFPVAGRPILDHVLDAVDAAGFTRTVVVVGYQHQLVRDAVAGRGVEFALQEEQLGTGHAVHMAAPLLKGVTGTTAVLAGDVPLIRASTLRGMVDSRESANAAISVLTAILPDATGYGRIIRDDRDMVTAIVEHRDCTEEQLLVREINSSLYAFDTPFLVDSLPKLNRNNEQGEYYLTDTVSFAVRQGLRVVPLVGDDFQELSGVNTRDQLVEAEQALARRGDAS